MNQRQIAAEASGAWIGETGTVILRTIACLASECAEACDPRTVRFIRDLADHAAIWSELTRPGANTSGCPWNSLTTGEEQDLEAWMLIARAAGALAVRFNRRPMVLAREADRAAICCLADIDEHAEAAAELLRNAERRGLGQDLRDAWCGLPSRREFAASSCLPADEEASSAA